MAPFLKINVAIQFLRGLAVIGVKNVNFSPNFFGEDILKISYCYEVSYPFCVNIL
jgi:hypothetical protein